MNGKWLARGAVGVLIALVGACSAASDPAPLATRAAHDQSSAAAAPPVSPNSSPTAPLVLAFGDSLYAGYQLDPNDSYPAQLGRALNAAGVAAQVVNAGVSGDTTAAALARLRFTLDGQAKPPALVLVGLGGNDMLRGLDPATTRANLEAILTELDHRHLPVVLTGMLAAPNLGAAYAAAFNPIWPQLAKAHHAVLVPFFLAPVIGQPQFLLGDHMHPNAAGVARIVVATEPVVAEALAKVK